MHRAAGLRVRPDSVAADVGVRVLLRIGPVRAPCQVVWRKEEETSAGFAYGTLVGHPECGEEAFLVEQRPDGVVVFTVWAFSRPAAWYLRAVGPLGRWVQRVAAGHYGRSLRRCVANV